jgi:heat shock protein HtpX
MQALGLQTYIWNNNLRSIFLLAGFPVLLLVMVFGLELAALVTGLLPSQGTFEGDVEFALGLMAASTPVALGVALVWFAIAYLFNQVIIDAATGSRKVERKDEPELYNLLENLAISRGLKTPALRVIESDEMNAFASGLHPGRFSITVTRGLMQNLTKPELEAVLAHELSHIINRDVRTMVIAAIFAGIITFIAEMIFRSMRFTGGRGRGKGGGAFILIALAIAAIGYVLAIVGRMAISRSREYVADAGSVELTKNPDAMISALTKVSGHAHLQAPETMRAMFLENRSEGIMSLFATHPPIERRIAALRQYAGGRIIEPAGRQPPPTGQIVTPAGRLTPKPDQPTVSRVGPWGRGGPV